MAASDSRPARRAPPTPPAYPSATASASSEALTPVASAVTSPGKVADPTAWEKKASRLQDDPGAHHAAGQREQHDLDQRLAKERQLDEVDRRGHGQSLNENRSQYGAERAALRTNRRDTAWSSMSCCSERWCPPGRRSRRLGSWAAANSCSLTV